jgi:hypothetical protein
MQSIKDILSKAYLLQSKSFPKETYECEIVIDSEIVDSKSVSRLLSMYPYEQKKYREKSYRSEINPASKYRYRLFQDQSSFIDCKSRLFVEGLQELWSRIILSCEVELDISEKKSFEGIKYENVQRYSIQYPITNGYLIIDISNRDDSYWIEVEFPFSTIESYVDNFDILSEESSNCIREIVIVLQDSNVFISKQDYDMVKKLSSFDYSKPVTLNKSNVNSIKNSKYISKKYDGTRCFLVFLNNNLFCVDIKYNIDIIITDTNVEGVHLLDCEKVGNVYYIMDMIYYMSEKIVDKPTKTRLSYRKYFEYDNIKVKPFVKFTKLSQVLELFYSDDGVISDGIIFVGNDYKNIFKWKQDNTIDLLYDNGILYDSNNNKYDVGFRDTNIPNKTICEFSVVDECLIFRKIRPDKPRANSYRIIMNNTTNIIPISFFNGEGAFFMRKYHNEIKKHLILYGSDYHKNIRDKILIDIGTGQLGDINKWKSFANVYCIEPDIVLFKEGFDRITKFSDKNKISAIHYKLSEYSKFSHMIPKKACMVNLFFCMNQFDSEDFNSLKLLLKQNTSKKSIVSIIALTSPVEDNNDCFELKLLGNKMFNLIIKSTRIVNVTERIVHKRSLVNYFKSLNYQLICEQILNDDKFMSTNELKLSSMFEVLMFEKSN